MEIAMRDNKYAIIVRRKDIPGTSAENYKTSQMNLLL